MRRAAIPNSKQLIMIFVGILAIALIVVLSVNADNYPDKKTDLIESKESPIDSMDSPCGEGFYLAGDICDKIPPGYVETRNECEMGVDSMESAGVDQDYQLELEKCR